MSVRWQAQSHGVSHDAPDTLRPVLTEHKWCYQPSVRAVNDWYSPLSSDALAKQCPILTECIVLPEILLGLLSGAVLLVPLQYNVEAMVLFPPAFLKLPCAQSSSTPSPASLRACPATSQLVCEVPGTDTAHGYQAPTRVRFSGRRSLWNPPQTLSQVSQPCDCTNFRHA
eukprot:218242-Rhodomonas_salina.5